MCGAAAGTGRSMAPAQHDVTPDSREGVAGKLAARTTIGQMNVTFPRRWLGVVVFLAVVGGSMPAWLR